MRLRPSALVLALLLAAAPVAQAGTESDPDVPGVPDHDDPSLDFLAAWFEPHPDGVKFTVKVASAPRTVRDQFYGVSFQFQGARITAMVALDGDGRTHSDLRAPGTFSRSGPQGLSGTLEDVHFKPGTPAYASAVIPYEALAGLAPGKVLVDLYGGTGTWSAAGGWNDVDGRLTSNAFVVKEAPLAARLAGSAGLAIAGGVFGAAVAGGVALVVMRRRGERLEPAHPEPGPPAEEPRGLRTDPRR